MAAAATIPVVSLDEYLHTTYEPDVDFVDGHIEERNLGEIDHADLQTIIATIFRVHQKDWKVKAYTEVRVQVGPRRFRVPDVTVVETGRPRTRIIREAPLLCIEVLSPEDRWVRVQRRFQDYLEMGVREVWVFDPETRTAYVLRREGAPVEHREGALSLAGTAIELPLAEVFAVLDEGR
jgi:Uma2 family endonuclease